MNGILKPVFIAPIKHIYQLFTNSNYLTYNQLYSKLKNIQRYQESEVKINHYNFLIPDTASFLSAYKEIFLERIYEFSAKTDSPKILDLGANIGLSVLFFKDLYPNSEITALEADTKIFSYLKKNIDSTGYEGIKLINQAVWYENTILSFMSEGADAGQIVSETNESNNKIDVKAIDISELLQKNQFDFIKMDIEGAEEFVVPRCKGLLDSVQHFFIEYHSKVGQKQKLNEILYFLAQEGFRIYMENPCEQPTPFLGLNSYLGFDFQMNIYAWKE